MSRSQEKADPAYWKRAKKLSKEFEGRIQPQHKDRIFKRLTEMPTDYQRTYMRAMTGKSRQAAMDAFCQMCVCWQREEVRKCSDPACPLYRHRPYQDSGS